MFVADAHCDTLFRLEKGAPIGSISREALALGGVGLQIFALFNGQPPPLADALELAQRQMDALNCLSLPLWLGKLPEEPFTSPTAVFSIEGAEILEGSLQRLAWFRQRGVRLMNLTWNHVNDVGIPALVGPGPLTAFGKKLLHAMGEMGVLCDVSHLNEEGFWQVMELSSLPVVASHSCARALARHPRNLTNEQIRALIAQKGYMGINFCPEFLSDTGRADTQTIADHIDHVVQMGGIDIVGMGSDFDGIDATPEGMENASCYPALWEILSRRGYDEAAIARIAGLNLYKILRSASEAWDG